MALLRRFPHRPTDTQVKLAAAEADALRRRVVATSDLANELRKDYRWLANLYEVMGHELKDLKDENLRLLEDRDHLHDRARRLRAELSLLRKGPAGSAFELEAEVARLRADFAELTDRYEKLQVEAGNTALEVERLRALVTRRTDDFDATVTALQHEHAEVERLRLDVARLREERDDSDALGESLAAEVDRLGRFGDAEPL